MDQGESCFFEEYGEAVSGVSAEIGRASGRERVCQYV